MKTNNLKDLKKLLPSHVGKFRPTGKYTFEYTDLDCMVKYTKYLYNQSIIRQKHKLDNIFIKIYGKKLNIPEKEVSNTLFRIKEYGEKAGKPLLMICNELRSYTNFYRTVGDKQIPVDGERIMKAYFAKQQKKSSEEIKNILHM